MPRCPGVNDLSTQKKVAAREAMQDKKIKLVGHVPEHDAHLNPRVTSDAGRRRRIFLLSPANATGVRGRLILGDSAQSPLAQRLRVEGAPLGEVFSFISGLYFRGKLAYAQRFAETRAGIPGAFVITASGGLIPPETLITAEDLAAISAASISATDRRYREPLERDARAICKL